MNKDYKGFLKLLKYHKVKYVIIGNYAYSCYVEPRSTIDLDILVESTRENAEKMVKVLENFDFKPENLKWRYFAEKGNKIQLGHEPLIIDILTSIPGVTWNEVWKNRVRGVFGNANILVNFIGEKQLIKCKKTSSRLQDLVDYKFLIGNIKEADGLKHLADAEQLKKSLRKRNSENSNLMNITFERLVH